MLLNVVTITLNLISHSLHYNICLNDKFNTSLSPSIVCFCELEVEG